PVATPKDEPGPYSATVAPTKKSNTARKHVRRPPSWRKQHITNDTPYGTVPTMLN
ncbi:hypothetical protein LTS03_011513, partial [Exophiala xenobiotica]